MYRLEVYPVNFDFSNVVGITENQLRQHYQLYLGYIKQLNRVNTTLPAEISSSFAYRGLKEAETYALDGIVLHELYFANLGQSPVQPAPGLLQLINRDFGSYDIWLDDFLRTGKTARGWAVLAFSYRDYRLHNLLQDAHNVGPVWQALPLLVLDVYEHAYLIQFGINKEKYLEIFKENINWQVVNNRFQPCLFP